MSLEVIQYEGYGVDLGKIVRPQPPYSPESKSMDQLVSCAVQYDPEISEATDWLDGVQIVLPCNTDDWEMLFYIPSDQLSWLRTSSKESEYAYKLSVAIMEFLFFANSNGYITDEYREKLVELLPLVIKDHAGYGTWIDYF